jgi:PhnB protein
MYSARIATREFNETPQSNLERRVFMREGTAASQGSLPATPHFVRPGFNNIAPYILVNGAAEFIQFLKAAFAGTERIRVPQPDGSIMHAELGVGDSVIELGDANEQHPVRPTAIHLYVEDADTTFARAVKAGGTVLQEVSEMPWGDRQGTVKDKFGNEWYIGMPQGWTPGPEGMRSVQPYLHLRDAHKFIPFAEASFGAAAEGVALSEEGKVLHATIRVGSGTLEIDEASGEVAPPPCYLHIYVPDADTVYANALRAGATSVEAPNDKPYGERSAGIKDPFGNVWWAATYLGDAGT